MEVTMNMISEFNYEPGFLPVSTVNENALVLAMMNKKILMYKKVNIFHIPNLQELKAIDMDRQRLEYIGKYRGDDCYCIEVNDDPELPENIEAIEISALSRRTENPDYFKLAGVANHILHWRNGNRYCGRCGSKMVDKEDERAMQCKECGNIVYPRISPAVITAVFRGDQILLAHNYKFRSGFYSLIAGFVEPGETLEHCVKREIMEEVGIRVKNVRYAGSQPWSFPDSLMLAFTAEYDSGEISVDGVEIEDAGWYRVDNLPEIPSTDSIAGRLIRWYIENGSKSIGE
jgi:NAD+ diphosphatase